MTCDHFFYLNKVKYVVLSTYVFVIFHNFNCSFCNKRLSTDI